MLPMGRGVYYQSPAGWTSLPFTILTPSINAGRWTLWPSTTVVEIRSPHPEVRVSTFKPTLYLRNISAAVPIYLVREIQVNDSRKLRINLRRDEQELCSWMEALFGSGRAEIRPLQHTPLLPASTKAHARSFSALSSRFSINSKP
jgi:hypothetical protein